MNQKQALDILKSGKNVLLTGPPGSGKTHLLNRYKTYLKENNIPVSITASTGVAATHLEGRTIHSWSGIGIKEKLTDKMLKDITSRNYLIPAIENSAVLIIDEVSMLHSFQFDMVNKICREIRGNVRPFGGLQVICSGDFFQLPPVPKRGMKSANWVVESWSWANMDIETCYLDEQFRHKDERLMKALKKIRRGEVDEETVAMIMERKNKEIDSEVEPARLFTHNKKVDAINSARLKKIDAEPREYKMSGEGKEKLIETLTSNCLSPETLILKKGAKVMFTKNNFDRGYVNGTLGKVMNFDADGYPVVKTAEGTKVTAMPDRWSIEDEYGKSLASVTQIPLRLAWAITIHKSQGMTLDAAEIDLSRSFEKGMGYVALSRVKSLSNVKLRGLNDTALQVSEKARRFDALFRKQSRKARKRLEQLEKQDRKDMHQNFLGENKKDS